MPKSKKSQERVSIMEIHWWLSHCWWLEHAGSPLWWPERVHRHHHCPPQTLQSILPSLTTKTLACRTSKAGRSVSEDVLCLLLTSWCQVVSVWRGTFCSTLSTSTTVGKAELVVCYGFPLGRVGIGSNLGQGGVADLCFSNFRLCSGARVVSNLQTREQDKARPLYLGFWGSGPAAASPAAQMTAAAAAAYFPMPVNSRRRSSSIRKDVLVKSFPVFSITSFAPPVRKSLRNFLKYMFLISLEAGLSPIHRKLIVQEQWLVSPVWPWFSGHSQSHTQPSRKF